MKSEEERQDYVLGESGLIWRGTYKLMKPTPWQFGQFEAYVLECSLYLLAHVGRLPPTDRSDPIKVSRHISGIVNSPDDDGVVEGKWDGNYPGGRAPTTWTGSAQILQQYWKRKRPVKYGQCWVFAGVCNTSKSKWLPYSNLMVSNK